MKNFLSIIDSWLQRIFQTPETSFVFILGVGLVLLTALIGDLLMPVFISIGIAYVMTGFKNKLQQLGLPYWLAFSLSFAFFMFSLVLALFVILPLMIRQIGELAGTLPEMSEQLQTLIRTNLGSLPISIDLDLETLLNSFLPRATDGAAALSSTLLAQLGNILTLAIYLLLVPVMVLFLMKDYREIIQGILSFIPGQKSLAFDLWTKVDHMLSNYVRGKVLEILIVWIASQILFTVLGLQYAALLALLNALSVIVPIVGVIVITIPVLVIGLLQWGLAGPFFLLLVSYSVLQFLEGYVLAPLIFSEAMKIHSLTVILAVLLFGGLWGFWGAFLAIPLATLIKILLESWPTPETDATDTS
ncbi:MAG: AI-2E family transporter [Gammaproteobacteria bacterium]